MEQSPSGKIELPTIEARRASKAIWVQTLLALRASIPDVFSRSEFAGAAIY
jgi:hypothetical protein